MPKRTKTKRQKLFFSYTTIMSMLDISRRTLQRWIDDMEIVPLVFEDHLRVFLDRPAFDRLMEYQKVMGTHSSVLIQRYRLAIRTDNKVLLTQIRKQLAQKDQ